MHRTMNYRVILYILSAAFVITQSIAIPMDSQFAIDTQNVQHLEALPAAAYEYTIIPSSEYNIKDNSTSEISLVDCILNPLTVLVNIGINIVSIVKWIVITISPVLLGMGLVIGFCAFTDYCTLTIEYPFSSNFDTIGPYLDDVEHYVVQSYNKYHHLQNQIL